MKKLFIKLDLNFNNLKISTEKDYYFKNSTGTFFQYNILKCESIHDIMEMSILPDLINVTKIIYPGITKHTDSWKTALNYYINSNETDITTFYTYPKTYINFKQHDVYLMNTHIPHEVTLKNKNSERLILRFIWFDYNIDEVYDSIILK